MAVLRLVRFTVEPSRADEMMARRADLIAATRATYPGLVEARLTSIDERTWLDMWRWESRAHAEAAIRGADQIPGVAAAFATASDLSAEFVEVVDER
jgi:quinol monooxygenase YgiN